MSHARTQVIAKVAELIGGTVIATPPNGKLKVLPIHDAARAETPVAGIAWQSDDVIYERVMGSPLIQVHTLGLAVVLRVKIKTTDEGDVGLADECDDLSLAVEALLQQERLTGIVSAWKLTGTLRDIDATGEQPVLQNTLLYQAQYKTRANNPAVIIV